MGAVWIVLGLAALAALVVLAVRSTHKREAVQSVRRRLLIGACLCAASLVAACRRSPSTQRAAPKEPAKVDVMARLGDVWREITRHSRGQIQDEGRYAALGQQMEVALERLREQVARERLGRASADALEAAFRDRYSHIDAACYPKATCYSMVPIGYDAMESHDRIERQIEILGEMKEKGRLPEGVVTKAENVVARELAFQRQADQALGGGYKPAAVAELHKRYEQGAIEPTDAATEAAKALVEFTTEPGNGA